MAYVSGKVLPGCSNAGNPFHECTEICFERLNSGDVHKQERKLFGFITRTPTRDTPSGSPARGSRSPLASFFGTKKVEKESSASTDHTNGSFFSRLAPIQGRRNEPENNVDSLPMSPSLALYSEDDYFARRTDPRGGEDDDMSPRPFGTRPKTPEHPLRTPQHRLHTPQHRSDPWPWSQPEDPISLETRPRTPERPSNASHTRPRTPLHESAATGRRPQTPETRPRTPERPSNPSFDRPRTPTHESAATGRRPHTPETRPRTPERPSNTSSDRPKTPIHDSAATRRRPQTPETRPRTPERPSNTSSDRPRTPIHDSAATGRRPQTPETRQRTPIHESAAVGRRPQTPETRPTTAQHRGRSPEYMARSPGPRSKTPEPQPTYYEPLSRTPKPRSKTPVPSPRIPQTQPISHRSLDSATLQMPRTVETRPILHESRPKTADHREKISQTQQASYEMNERSAQAYNYLGSKAESVYIENDDESVLLFRELLLSPQEKPHSRPITPNRRGYETPTNQEEHFDQLDDSASTDDDKFSFVDEHDDSSVWLYHESGSSTPVHNESGKSRSQQEEQDKANSEPPELPDESQSFSHTETSGMKGIIVKEDETRDEIQSILSESQVSVGDYRVRASVSATLQHILDKHGDIAAASKPQSLATRSYYLDMLASVVLELQTTPLKHLNETRMEEMVAIVKDAESVKIKANWLRPILEEIVEAVKHYDEHNRSIMDKQVLERDVLLAKQEMEKKVKELRGKENKMKECRERMTEMAGKLGTLDMTRERLDKSLAFLSSKVDKFQGRSLLQGIL